MNLKKIQLIVFLLIILIFFLLFNLKQDKNINNKDNEEKMKIVFLDVGQGDSILINFVDNTQMLVDCSEDARVLEALGRNMDYYDKTIDYLLITHPHSDHYGGCEEVLNRFEVKNIIYNGLEVKSNKSWQSFLSSVEEKDIDLIKIDREFVWQISSSSLHFLYPDYDLVELENNKNLNNTSIVFGLNFNSTTILFTGDAEIEIEDYMMSVYGEGQLKTDILKAGHHGSDTSSGQDFLNLVNPSDTIVSVGIVNSHGHPSRRILKRLERINTNIWRTDLVGDIVLEIGESGYEIRTPQISQ